MIFQAFNSRSGRKVYINPEAITCLLEIDDEETAIYFSGEDDHLNVKHSLKEVVQILSKLEV